MTFQMLQLRYAHQALRKGRVAGCMAALMLHLSLPVYFTASTSLASLLADPDDRDYATHGVVQCAEWPDEYPVEGGYPELLVDGIPTETGPAELILPPLSASKLESLQTIPDEGDEGEVVMLDPDGPAGCDCDYYPYIPSERVLGYNPTTSATTWIPGDGDKFGWVSLENFATIGFGQPVGWSLGTGFHFLDGPVTAEMPPRLFDFSLGYQRIEWIRPNFGWDFLFRVGVFSDFEGSAKDGLRFPSHLVTYWRLTPTTTFMLGVNYLDWDTLRLLPVVGWTWVPNDDFRVDLAFPRPRVAMRIRDSDTWLALGGELSGGTWAIERARSINDNATYSDLRLVFSIENRYGNSVGHGLELGYVFHRELRYSSGVTPLDPGEAFMMRFVTRY